MSTVIEKARDLIKEFEGCLLTAYLDSAGIPTIGYGHTGPDVHMGQVITQKQADDLLTWDMIPAVAAVRNFVMAPLNDCQFAALVSLVFNIGSGAFRKSTLLAMLNEEDYEGAAKQFLRWNHAGGVVVPGLTKRREREKAIFEEVPCL